MSYKFTGFWTPREIVDLYHEDTITQTEMVLLGIIHSLCSKGEGCTAGNQYLARLTKVGTPQIRRHLQRLEQVGLIFREKVDGVRVILTYLEKVERGFLGVRKDTPDKKQDRECVKTLLRASKDAPGSLVNKGMDKKVITNGDDVTGTETGGRQEELPFGEKPPLKFSERVAIQLTNTLLRNHAITSKPNLAKKWSAQIRLLTKQDGFTKEEVDQVIQWFRKHDGEKYVPGVHNEKMLRDKFPQLKRCMERSQQDTSAAAPPEKLKLTALEEEILERVLNWQWPKGANARMPQAVRISLRNFETAMAARRRGFQDPSLERFYDLVDNAFWNANPKTFLADHFHREFDRVKDWEGWSGDLKSVVWSVYHKGFTQRGQEFASQHGGVTLWDKFVAEITS